jgi:hypothetical protein
MLALKHASMLLGMLVCTIGTGADAALPDRAMLLKSGARAQQVRQRLLWEDGPERHGTATLVLPRIPVLKPD